MKRRLIIALLAAMACSQAGCGKKEDKNLEYTSISVDETETPESSYVEANTSPDQVEYVNNTPLIPREELPYTGEEYSCAEFSIVVPEKYKDLITADISEKGITLYQTASYEIDGSGFICSIESYDEADYMQMMGYSIAYTPTHSYILTLPSDVSCYYEDDDILNEYLMLSSMTDYLPYSLNVYADDVNYKASEYMLPRSEYVKLDKDSLVDYSRNSLIIARNEILARAGYDFELSSVEGAYYFYTYFANTSWYSPDETVTEDDLNDIEKANLTTLDELIAEKSADEPYCQMISGDEEISVDLDGDGVKESFSYIDAGPMDGKDLGFNPIITVDEDLYELWDYEQFGIPMDDVADHCYIIDLSPGTPGLQLAVLDYGPSNDEMTYIYSFIEDSLIYCGTVPGFFLYPDTALSGLDYNSIHTITRLDYVDTCWVETFYYYDSVAHTFDTYDSGLRNYRYANNHVLSADVDMQLSMSDSDITYKLKAGSCVKILGTDGQIVVKLMTEDGIIGYLSLEYDEYRNLINPESELTCDEIFSDRLLFD